MKEKNPFYITHHKYGFYFIQSELFQGFIGTIYNGYITFLSPVTEEQKKQIYSKMVAHTRDAKKASYEKREPIA